MRSNLIYILLFAFHFSFGQSDPSKSKPASSISGIYHSTNGKPSGVYAGGVFIYDLKGNTFNEHYSRRMIFGVDALHGLKTNVILGVDVGFKIVRLTGFGNFSYTQTFTKKFTDDFNTAFNNSTHTFNDSLIGDAFKNALANNDTYYFGACRDMNIGITFGYRFEKIKIVCRLFRGSESAYLESPNDSHFAPPNYQDSYHMYLDLHQTGIELSSNLISPLLPSWGFFKHFYLSVQYYQNNFDGFVVENTAMSVYTNDGFVSKYNKENKFGFSFGYIFRD